MRTSSWLFLFRAQILPQVVLTLALKLSIFYQCWFGVLLYLYLITLAGILLAITKMKFPKFNFISDRRNPKKECFNQSVFPSNTVNDRLIAQDSIKCPVRKKAQSWRKMFYQLPGPKNLNKRKTRIFAINFGRNFVVFVKNWLVWPFLSFLSFFLFLISTQVWLSVYSKQGPNKKLLSLNKHLICHLRY